MKVNAILIPYQKGWSIQCLEYDIAAQGKTISKAKKALERTIKAQIESDINDGRKPLKAIPESPKEYFEMFEQTKIKKLQPII